jgi:hypothetical protein
MHVQASQVNPEPLAARTDHGGWPAMVRVDSSLQGYDRESLGPYQGARRVVAACDSCPVSRADVGPLMTGIVRFDLVVRSPDVAPAWPHRSRA